MARAARAKRGFLICDDEGNARIDEEGFVKCVIEGNIKYISIFLLL